MKFLVDCCAGRRLAEWLRSEGYDVFDAGRLEHDPGAAALLKQAAAEGRIPDFPEQCVGKDGL